MLKRIRQLPSPALVISAIALIVAVGGGTFALASSSDNKKDKKIANKQINAKVPGIAKTQANKQINKKAPGLSVSHANTADNATNATDADTATSAGTLNGVSVKQFSVKVAPANSATLLDTGLVTFTGACSAGGDQSVTMAKDSGAPSEAARWSAIFNANTVATSGSSDFMGSSTITPITPSNMIQAEVTTTTGRSVSFSGMGRGASNFGPVENVCVFSGTVTSN